MTPTNLGADLVVNSHHQVHNHVRPETADASVMAKSSQWDILLILFNLSVLSFRILISLLESKFSYCADNSPFYEIIFNSKTLIGILKTDLDSKTGFGRIET